ncbi:ethylene-responsive transcription factor ERF017-like [Populus nigra]|uniref:ethylene-responsive transcription factor ERF017-like n=1 Tax=Populus nigra TaxID=3691 RepID=UPI002B26480D|nr:ethylene-responsive transcription factor ERF017-like [Populus nigra]
MVKFNTEKPVAERSDSKYKGVRKRKWGRWVSEIRLPNSRERIWLGSYDSAEKAAHAFDAALFCLRGNTMKFNFSENPPNIAGGGSLSPSEIQEAAARFANSEPQRGQSGKLEADQSTSVSESRPESPCLSAASDGTVRSDGGELIRDTPFFDMEMSTSSSNHPTEYGIFPGFDDLHSGFFAPSFLPNLGHGEWVNLDGVLEEDSFLWNF